MKIVGLQKLTLLDFPGKIACTVFLGGCNFRCPFCHNGQLLGAEEEAIMDVEGLMAFLESRRGKLEGVCITGGEPTLQPDLLPLLGRIKGIGYPLKLDTNGYRPDVLRAVLEEDLADYVAMDIKNSPERYAETVGLPTVSLAAVEESIRLLMHSSVEYEFRTTVVRQFHDEASVADMGRWLLGLGGGGLVRRMFLQPFVDRETVLRPGLTAPEESEIRAFSEVLRPFCESVQIRGI